MSWLRVPDDAPFGLEELPFGIFSTGDSRPAVGVAVGDRVIDVGGVARTAGLDADVFEQPTLNPLMALGPPAWGEGREVLWALLDDDGGREVLEPHLRPIDEVRMHLPFAVADYVDFYASEHHATNVGRMFRPDSDPLTPNWRHMPIGYHGRAGTVVPSGTDVVRPSGQRKAAAAASEPSFGPSRRLDLEAELGFVVGVGSAPGSPVPMERFAEHVFGVVLLNDWSARDLQSWEYVPLGPFLGKSFATSISAWVLPLAALQPAAIPLPAQRPALLPYLSGPSHGYDIEVEVIINETVVSRCPYASMYYSPAQMLAHLTVNGAHLRTGDLFGSGTISGPAADQRGSLLELSWNGTEPVRLADGERTFLADGDEVVLRGAAPSATGGRLRLGEVRGRVVSAA